MTSKTYPGAPKHFHTNHRSKSTMKSYATEKSVFLHLCQWFGDMDSVLFYCLYIFRCISNVYIKACPPGFDYLPEVDTCFTLISEAITWYNATERCRQMMPGSHLAAITSQKENDAITRYLQLQSSSKWIHVESRNCDYTAKCTIY